ncbi:MAG: helix-turn-helix domain-containing protein [Isosphaeraceae bacterium]|nr:helix-turn-helix domain-containing protein [Isosphaeraceae bacterium]
MAQFYTLEEAARVLGMNPEELKAKAQQREVRAFLDGGSWRFRVVDIDELARRRGMGSDAELPLSDLDVPLTGGDEDDVLSEYNLGSVKADLGQDTVNIPFPADTGSDHDLLIEELSLPPGPVSGSSSVIIGMSHGGGKLPSDSDVKLVPDYLKGASDSDVRLASPAFKAPSDSDVTMLADESSDQHVLSPGPGDTAVRQSPLLGSSAEVKSGEPGSDFELTPSSDLMDALEPDSGSDFELTALEEASDEFEATPLAGPSDSDVTAADPGLSGINLGKPSDSGINLMAAAGFDMNASSIELAPLSGDDIKSAPKPPAKPAAAAQPAKPKSSLAATPPPSVAKGEKDIFDDTDFEVDAFDSGEGNEDRTMQLEAASDFELEESDTGSEVFAIDEEDVDQNAATALGPASVGDEDEDEEDDPFAAATSGDMASAWDVESESASAPAGRGAPSPVLAPSAPSAEWGGAVIGMLSVATILMLFLAFVSLDLVRNLYEFRGDGPSSGIVKSLASLAGDK